MSRRSVGVAMVFSSSACPRGRGHGTQAVRRVGLRYAAGDSLRDSKSAFRRNAATRCRVSPRLEHGVSKRRDHVKDVQRSRWTGRQADCRRTIALRSLVTLERARLHKSLLLIRPPWAAWLLSAAPSATSGRGFMVCWQALALVVKRMIETRRKNLWQSLMPRRAKSLISSL
jgi:hypothetical protein